MESNQTNRKTLTDDRARPDHPLKINILLRHIRLRS
jgi:hypothetical protein